MGERNQMQGKRVLITGAGTGIGKGIALEFARRGAAVALHYSSSQTGARVLVDEIRAIGGRVEAFHADFTDIEQVKRISLPDPGSRKHQEDCDLCVL